MKVISRFAPSPTGLLHIGNVRTALITWLYTHTNQGKFILRFDDTDLVRSKEEYAHAIKEDLTWLGLLWDDEKKQSLRIARYEEIKNQLLEQGRLYACYETPEEIETKRKMLLGRGLPPIYDRSGLKLTDAQKAELEKSGRKPHYRFLIEDNKISWPDAIKGDISFQGKNLTDPILIREDGSMTYILCSVIDDIDFNVSHVIRGEDHISNTAIQCQIFDALKATIPVFAHLGLMQSKNSEISKRLGGFDIRSLREEGIEPITILAYLTRLGSSQPIEAFPDLNLLLKEFNLQHYNGKSSANYDHEELIRLNPKILHISDYNSMKNRFKELEIEISEEFWLSTRGNISKLLEIKEWQRIAELELEPVIDIENNDFLVKACKLLPIGGWDEHTYDIWIEKVKSITDLRGKNLFMPIRKALTARENGPELKKLLPLIGREKAINRLNGIKS